MLHIIYQAPQPSGSEEDFLKIYSMYFYGSNKPRNPWDRAIVDPGATI